MCVELVEIRRRKTETKSLGSCCEVVCGVLAIETFSVAY